MKKTITLGIGLLLFCFATMQSASAQCTFTNPIRGEESADPHIAQKDGMYYLMVTTGDVQVRWSTTLEGFKNAPGKVLWSRNNVIVSDIWAPELHFVNGCWYIYACGSIGNGFNMRMFVLQADNPTDPLGSYTFKGLLDNMGAIDESIWQDPSNGKLYMTWSMFEGIGQTIWIAPMDNPTTLGHPRVRISAPIYDWEKKNNDGVVGGRDVNEGPIFIKRNNKLHITYSASGCESIYYSLGLLTCENGNYLDANSWKKATQPVFQQSNNTGVYGPGHNGFAKSHDGTEDWLVYHGKSTRNATNGDRSTRIQKFTWDSNDMPVFGEPVRSGQALACPSNVICTEARSAHSTMTIPGVIEAENYDKGCEGQAYHDEDVANKGNTYRTNGVDIEACKEGGNNVCWTVAGEWLEYSVNVTKAGRYNVDVRVASITNNGAIHIEVNGVDKTGKIAVPGTGDWQNWTNVNTSLMLPAGNVVIRMFFEGGDLNINKMTFTPDAGDGLSGQYYNGMNFEQAKFSRKDANINFDWQVGSPDPSINNDAFSVRWTGQILAEHTQNYTFFVNSDNGRRLWVNNKLIIDGWISDYGKEYSGSISLEAGKKYDIKLEYFEDFGGANCKLEWSSPNQPRQVVPQSHLYASNPVVVKPGFSTPTIAYANDWVATDGVGRTLPGFNDLGGVRSEKYVGMFYWLWHSYIRLNNGKQKIVPELLKENPNSPAFECRDYYWGEPENGFYHPRDPWSTRRNLQMLANAGIDFIYIDFTNGSQGCDALTDFMNVALDMHNKGIPVPKVLFFMYANMNDAINCVMDNFYNKPAYQPLWFYWEGKPLIMADQARACSQSSRACTPAVKDFFTWRKTWAFDENQWNFIDSYPQKVFSVNGVAEQITVQKSMGAPINNHDQGSSYHDGIMPQYDQYWETPLSSQGLYFDQYWKRAHQADPKIICVTGWNELCAAAWPTESLRFMGKNWNDPRWRCVNHGNCLNTKNGVHTPHGWHL